MTAQEHAMEPAGTPTGTGLPKTGHNRAQTVAPWTSLSLLTMRAFAFRSARYLARRHGIGQFISWSVIDERLGRGAAFSTQVPCAAVPDAGFVHVEAVPAAGGQAPVPWCPCAHARTVFRGVLPLLRTPSLAALDRDRPIGVLIDDTGPWTTSDADLRFTLDALRGWLPPGSAIALTHTTNDSAGVERWRAPALRARGRRTAAVLTKGTGGPCRPRTRAQISSLLEPWPLTEHGLAATGAFFAGHRHSELPAHPVGSYAAITLHPDPA